MLCMHQRHTTAWQLGSGKAASQQVRKESPVLPRLAGRVQDMAVKDQLEPRAVAKRLLEFGAVV